MLVDSTFRDYWATEPSRGAQPPPRHAVASLAMRWIQVTEDSL